MMPRVRGVLNAFKTCNLPHLATLQGCGDYGDDKVTIGVGNYGILRIFEGFQEIFWLNFKEFAGKH